MPPFARVPYQPFSRTAVVAIARANGACSARRSMTTRPAAVPSRPAGQSPSVEPGLWQRVGEYWWEGMPPDSRESGWTGKHGADGVVFPADEDWEYAWSAAFIDYVMRIAGAGNRFPYAADHAHYINIAKQMALGRTSGWLIAAEQPDAYAPRPGDLICTGRGDAAGLTYDDLPAARFPAHCDIVVDTSRARADQRDRRQRG